jgi:hypothetical protein
VDTQEQAGRPEPQLTTKLQQRGWVGLIALLLALVIVAMLAQTALKRYGLLAAADAPAKTAASRAPGDATPADVDPATAAPIPRNALERARGLENAVRKQADDLGKQIDDTAK